jgi:hypothetical protein
VLSSLCLVLRLYEGSVKPTGSLFLPRCVWFDSECAMQADLRALKLRIKGQTCETDYYSRAPGMASASWLLVYKALSYKSMRPEATAFTSL